MQIYARSDLAYVFVSDVHGGCGNPHSRPVSNGAPAKIWVLDCEPCANHLRHDSHWATTIAKLPETYDEEAARKDFEQRGALDERKLMAMALAKLTGLQIPETIAGAITGRLPHIPGEMECPAGHAQPAGQKFCGDCGSPMHGVVAKAEITQKAKQDGRPRRMRDARLDELQALARSRGLDESGNRPDLIARLAAAGVTSNDLAALALVGA